MRVIGVLKLALGAVLIGVCLAAFAWAWKRMQEHDDDDEEL